jgi:hypothetical protein
MIVVYLARFQTYLQYLLIKKNHKHECTVNEENCPKLSPSSDKASSDRHGSVRAQTRASEIEVEYSVKELASPDILCLFGSRDLYMAAPVDVAYDTRTPRGTQVHM